MRLPQVDYPDITILGWTPTHDQWTAGTAVLAGALAAVVLLALVRKTRKLVFAAVLTGIAVFVWARFLR